MVMLLLPGAAAVLHSHSCYNLQQVHSRFFSHHSAVSSCGLFTHWGISTYNPCWSVYCTSNDDIGDPADVGDEQQVSETSVEAPKEDKKDLLEPLRTPVSKQRSLNTALRRYLFVSRDSKTRSRWADRRTAVMVVQNASNLGNALARVGDKLEVSDLNLLLRRFANLSRSDDACQLFDWMEKEGKVSASSYSTFIIALGKVGRIQKALFVYNTLKDEMKLNPFVGNAMLSALVNNWKIRRAFRLFGKMKEWGFNTDHITYSTMLNGCLRIHNGFEKSQKLLEEMKTRGLTPDAYAYGSLLRVYCAYGLEQEAKALVEEMTSQGIGLTLYHFSYLLHLYARVGKQDEAEKVFASIKEAGLEPNEVVYRALLNVYGSNGLVEDAKNALYAIQASGIQPDMIMYSCVMDAYVRCGKLYEAHELLIEMIRKGVRPGGNAYSMLIYGYGEMGDLDMVNKLAIECRNRKTGYQDVRLYNSLLKAYSLLNHDDGITNTLERMDTEGIMPDKASFNILIDYLFRKRMFGLALRTYRDMRSRGLGPNPGTYSRLLEGLTKPLLEDRPESRVSQLLSVAERRKGREIDLLSEAYTIFKEMLDSEVYCHKEPLETYIKANAMNKNWPVAVEALDVMRKARYKTSQELLETLLKRAVEDNHYGVMSELLRQVKSQRRNIDPQILETVKQKFIGEQQQTVTK